MSCMDGREEGKKLIELEKSTQRTGEEKRENKLWARTQPVFPLTTRLCFCLKIIFFPSPNFPEKDDHQHHRNRENLGCFMDSVKIQFE